MFQIRDANSITPFLLIISKQRIEKPVGVTKISKENFLLKLFSCWFEVIIAFPELMTWQKFSNSLRMTTRSQCTALPQPPVEDLFGLANYSSSLH